MTALLPRTSQAPARTLRLSTAPEIPPPAEMMDGLSLWRIIHHHIRLVLLIAFALFAIPCAVILSGSPTYTAQTRVLIHKSLAADLALGSASVDTPDIDLEVERLRSREIAAATVKAFALQDRPEFNPALRKPSFAKEMLREASALVFPQPAEKAVQTNGLDAVLGEFNHALSLQRQGSTAVVVIGFASKDPALAAAVPNTIVGIYQRNREAQWQSRADVARKWLNERIETQKVRLNDAMAALRDSGLAAEHGDTGLQQGLQILYTRRAAIFSDRFDLRNKLAAIDASLKSGEAAPVDEPANITALRTDLHARQITMERLARTFGKNYGGIIDARSQIANLQSSIRDGLLAWKAGLQHLDRSLADEAQGLDKRIAEGEALLAKSGVDTTARGNMVGTVEADGMTLGKLLHKLDELNGEAALPTMDVEVLSPATVPAQPAGASRKLLLLVALGASFIVAVTVAAVAELLDRSLRDARQLADNPDLQVASRIGAIPRRQARDLTRAVQKKPYLPLLENLNLVMRTLEAARNGTFPHSLVVTGAARSVGATFVARALALDLASRGHRVLYIDYDNTNARALRRHADTTRPEVPGLTEFLRGEVPIEKAAHHDPSTNLTELLAFEPGRLPVPTATRIGEIMSFASSSKMLVVIDCPPVLGGASTLAFASMCDASCLVARWGKTSLRTVERAAADLSEVTGETRPILLINRTRGYDGATAIS